MKKLLFSITKDDCVFQTFRSGGKGGQNQNKVESGVRVIHPPSGAIGESREHRDQLQNKRSAFRRMAETKEFIAWHRIQAAARMQGIVDIDRMVEKLMAPENLKVEYYTP
jgi:protein subunit release factor B